MSYKDNDGKYKDATRGGFKTKKEATLFANNVEIEKANGELKSTKPQLFREYFWEWYETYKESTVRQRTQTTYLQAYNILKKYLPTQTVNDMDRLTYQKFLKSYGKTHAKSTVSKMSSLYHAAVKDGLYDGIFKKDFIQGTSLVFNKNNTRKIEYLNETELKTLVKYLLDTRQRNNTSKYMIITALMTGMRPGEVGGLRWPDINRNFNIITIKQSWNESTKDFEPLKNETSYRHIKVDPWLIDLLDELPTQQDSQKRVFANHYYGTIPTSSAVNKVITDSLKSCNIDRKGFHFHSCRHAHVAYLLSQGIDIYAISKRLGHADVIVTMRVYAYLIDEFKARNDEKIINATSSLHPKTDDNKVEKESHL